MIIAAFAAMALTQTSCEKVSPQGVLMAGTGVEDRVKMSEAYYRDYLMDSKNDITQAHNNQSLPRGLTNMASTPILSS